MKTVVYSIWFLLVLSFCVWGVLTGFGMGLAYYYELSEEKMGFNSLIIRITNYHLLLSSLYCVGFLVLFVFRNSWEKTRIVCGILIIILLVYLIVVLCFCFPIMVHCSKDSSDLSCFVSSLRLYIIKPILLHAALSAIMVIGTGVLWRRIQIV